MEMKLDPPVVLDSGMHRGERGFTYVETAVAALVLVIGLTGVLGLLGYTLLTLALAEDELIAKQKAREALESLITARNTEQLVFDDIRNESGGGIFLDGFHSLRLPNPKGLVGTATDGPLDEMLLPGQDDMYGTDDDEVRSLERFKRQIEITDLGTGSDLRKVVVSIRYTTRQGWERSYEVQSYVSRYR